MKGPLNKLLHRSGKWHRLPFNRNIHAADTVEHLKAGQISKVNDSDFPALVLKGQCESRHDSGETLHVGDPVDDLPFSVAGTVRAIVDTAILRLPRQALARLVQRWPKRTPSIKTISASQTIQKETGKMVCLVPLSDELPCAEFALRFAETITRETGSQVFILQIDETPDSGDSPNPALENEKLQFRRVPSREFPGLMHKLKQTCDGFPYVITVMARDTGAAGFAAVMRECHTVYPVLRQDGESLFEITMLVREANAQGLGPVPIKPLVYLEADENAHGLSDYIKETVNHPVHFYLREEKEGDSPQLQANLRRLGREICGCQVGLALSSGAARGLSHIGVIQVLEENGIEVDVVAGSSMGAYVAAVWGAGYTGYEMEQFAKEVKGYRGLWSLLDIAIFPLRGFLRTRRVRHRLEQTIGSLHFSDMTRPIRVVATCLDTLECVVFSSGDMVDAVLASIAIPGICVPVTLNGVRYVDGGMTDPLPVDVLCGMGIEKIIAVNTIATPETRRACNIEFDDKKKNTWVSKLNACVNFFARGNAFDTMLLSFHAGQTRLAEASCLRASVVLRPYTCEGRWHDFGNPSRYISVGRQAAEEQLPALRALFESNEKPKNSMAQVA